MKNKKNIKRWAIILGVVTVITLASVYNDKIMALADKLNPSQTVGTNDNSSIQTIGNDKTGNSIITIGHE